MSRSPLASRYHAALVTGAGAGLGRAFVEMLLAEGVEVWGTSRRPESLPVLPKFHAVGFDLAGGDAAAEALVTQVARESGGIDLLVHNAGYGVFGGLLDRPLGVWRAQLDEMLGTSLALDCAVFAAMAPHRRGCIVNVTSMAVEFPIPFLVGYNVAKAGLAALTESLMFEAREAEIAVIDFRPGDYRTGFNQTMFATQYGTPSALAGRIAARLDATLAAAPLPDRAARDLRRALGRGRSGVVRSGSFFQTVLAPLGARLAPLALRRVAMARYFGAP
jgi:NAD(P)-dependent dehydrogenase (short-subunit alcohol dehydrogenase family)